MVAQVIVDVRHPHVERQPPLGRAPIAIGPRAVPGDRVGDLQVAGALAVGAIERGWAACPERIGGLRPPDRRPRARTNGTLT
jgi:hypothetical protein